METMYLKDGLKTLQKERTSLRSKNNEPLPFGVITQSVEVLL